MQGNLYYVQMNTAKDYDKDPIFVCRVDSGSFFCWRIEYGLNTVPSVQVIDFITQEAFYKHIRGILIDC